MKPWMPAKTSAAFLECAASLVSVASARSGKVIGHALPNWLPQ